MPDVFLPLLQMDKNPDGSLARSNYINDVELHVKGNTGNLEPLIRKIIEEVACMV